MKVFRAAVTACAMVGAGLVLAAVPATSALASTGTTVGQTGTTMSSVRFIGRFEDVQADAAMPAGDHCRQQLPGQLGKADDVQLKQVADQRRIEPIELPCRADPGVVDQNVYPQSSTLYFLGEASGRTVR